MKQTIFVTVIVCLTLMVLSPSALAHKVNIYAYVEGDTVFTESYFPDGKKVQNGKVTVCDGSGRLLYEGVTDANGRFNFESPQQHVLKIVLEASMGHRDEYILKLDGEDGQRNNPKEDGIPFKKVLYGIAAIFAMALPAHYFLKRKNV
ncbi:MAG: hypothetical protein JW800_05600 [Candidatus Omnitrophica bacterium]|nr:hypothetical protein [Candidatus Omnitrophota bacterium]